MTSSLDTLPPAYVPRDPSQTVLYQVIADHLETFLASLDADPDAPGLPAGSVAKFDFWAKSKNRVSGMQ
jgi:hypothetical protein